MSRSYLTAGRVAELQRSLSDRDAAVLAALARVRVATGRQLARSCFAEVSSRQARAALASLEQRRLLARLPRSIGGVRAGSAGYVYALDAAGQRLTRPKQERRYRPWPVGMSFLAHSLAVTELYVRLLEAERTGALQLTQFDTEPACWRPFPGSGDARVVLKPDAAVVAQLGRFEDRWFVEVDQGSEARTTLARKCDLYRRYWQTGVEQARTGVFPRVLWLVPDPKRQAALIDVIGRQPGEAGTLFAAALQANAVDCLLQGAGAMPTTA